MSDGGSIIGPRAAGDDSVLARLSGPEAWISPNANWTPQLRDMVCKMNGSDPATTIFHPFEDDEEQP